jgi:hypothetical protein
LTGVPTASGISVNTPLSLIALPYSFVTRQADFPIQPRPDRVASVLKGSRVFTDREKLDRKAVLPWHQRKNYSKI